MTINQAFQQLLHPLYVIYDQREAKNIAHLVLENITGYTKSERLVQRDQLLTDTQVTTYNKMVHALLQHKPVQYVLGESWFLGLCLAVNESVLIPRPETEELVELAIKTIHKIDKPVLRILDIGTGSGCIALAIKHLLPNAEVYATDISEKALETARSNALKHSLDVHFFQHNILEQEKFEETPFDVIISNPPYITYAEKTAMEPHVVNFEPHTALFVDDKDPLLFYRCILDFSKQNLTEGGYIFFEINESYASDMNMLVDQYQFQTKVLLQDLSGKDRFIAIQQ